MQIGERVLSSFKATYTFLPSSKAFLNFTKSSRHRKLPLVISNLKEG